MSEDKLHDLELKTLTNTLHIGQIADKIDSHFENTRLQHQKLFEKLESMPDEDRIIRLFTQEAEKLARGLVKKDDEQQEEIDGLKKNQIYVGGFGAGVAGVLTLMWNMFSK